jgi:ADA HAT complex component 1
MFRLPSWISESRGCDKVVNGEADHKMANVSRPFVEILSSGAPKRKRAGSEEALGSEITTVGTHEAKRWKPNALNHSSPKMESKEEAPVAEKKANVDSRHVREVIESQFSLEILLKHDELRLINQELAKCQAALEQLRRCHLIPYPVTQGTPEAMLNVSNGTGPAVRHGDTVPQWAAPYGVTDGPYSRHYAKWLIPDPAFDGPQAGWYPNYDGSRAGKTIPEGRATRHSFAEGSSTASKARSQRGSAGQKLHALSNGYPLAKEKAGPCVLKRAEDGQMVKLVCNDCQRENFSSTQGFINHCRIAHRKEYKSHEEAAIACGQPIELDEGGAVVGEDRGATAATGLVHPLIRTAPTDREAYVSLLSRIDTSLALFEKGELPGVTSIPGRPDSTPMRRTGLNSTPGATPQTFVPSPETPYLSNFMRNRGFGGNLPEIVGEAKKQVDLEELSSHGEESEEGESLPQPGPGRFDGTDSPLPPMRMPARTAMSPAPSGRPGSSKGVDAKNARKQGVSPRMSFATPVLDTTATANHNRPTMNLANDHRDAFHHHDTDGDLDMMGPSLVDLSPNTVTSNNAPSLVSDDGEYDDGDDDAESACSEDEDEGSDVAEIDIEDGEVEKVVPRTVVRNRSGSGGDGMRLRKEDKHVTFVSPVKETKDRRSRK